MSDTPKRPKRPTFNFDTAPEATPATGVKVEETALERKERLARESLERYNKEMGPEHARINAELERKGEKPLNVRTTYEDQPTEEDLEAARTMVPPTARSSAVIERAQPKPRTPPEIKTRVPQEDTAEKLNPHLPKIALNDCTNLPSGGLAYPEGASIKYRAYMLGEVEEFERSNLSEKEKYLLILRGIETNFDKLSLTLSDVMYLGLLRRIMTMGAEEVGVNTRCPRCGGPNTERVATAHIHGANGETVYFDELKVPALPVRMKLTFGEHHFMPITIGDYLSMQDSGIQPDVVSMTAIQCHTLDFPESIEIFRQVTDPKDIRMIRKLDELMYHGIAPVKVRCRNVIPSIDGGKTPAFTCDTPYTVSLENAKEAFIYPFRGDGDDDGDEIDFG